MGSANSTLEAIEARKSRVRESLALNGRRSNFVPPPHDPTLFSHIRNSYYLVPPKAVPGVNTLPLVRSLIKHNGTADAERLCAKYAFPVHSPGLRTWVQLQDDYIRDLSTRDKEVLASYTKYGDMLVNNYIRGTLGDIGYLLTDPYKYGHFKFLSYYILEQYESLKDKMRLPHKLEFIHNTPSLSSFNKINLSTFQWIIRENIEFLSDPANLTPFLEAYKQDLIRIISGAPRLLAPLVVYRGFKKEDHLQGEEQINPDFVSTSVNLDIAIAFSRHNDTHYENIGYLKKEGRFFGGVYEITVTPEIPCIYLGGHTKCKGEFEVLIPPGQMFSYDSRIYYKIVPALKGSMMANSEREDRVAIIHVAVDPWVPRVRSRSRSSRSSKRSSRKQKGSKK